jgi:hypothetical protein
MRERLSAVLHVLCDDESEYHSLVFFAVPQQLLAELLTSTISAEASELVQRVGNVPSLMSIVALGRLPGIDRIKMTREIGDAAQSLIQSINDL